MPSELRELGYIIDKIGTSERILATSISQKFTMTSSGALELMTVGSTKPMAEVRHHAGIVKVEVFEAELQ